MKQNKFNNGQFLNPFGTRGNHKGERKYLIGGEWVGRSKIVADLGITNGKFGSLMKFYDNDINIVIRKVNEKRT